MKDEVIELLSDDDDETDTMDVTKSGTGRAAAGNPVNNCDKKPSSTFGNPYLTDRLNLPHRTLEGKKHPLDVSNKVKPQSKKRKSPTSASLKNSDPGPRQAGLVLEEDVNERPPSMKTSSSDEDDELLTPISVDSYLQEQRAIVAKGLPAVLFEDAEFPTLPRSIQGPKREQKKLTCRCKGSIPAKLDYRQEAEGTEGQPGLGGPPGRRLKPFYRCAKKQCKYYANAFTAERFHWYRFGSHTGHTIVGPTGFSANDLCQGRVGDCWFLSALAVVAERPDLILRLFGYGSFTELNDYGICQVNLFLDGYWKTVLVDNFLPCLVDGPSESQLQAAIRASLGVFGGSGRSLQNGMTTMGTAQKSSSRFNPSALADQCRKVLRDTREFLQQDVAKNRGAIDSVAVTTEPISRPVTSEDLAYSKAKSNQLWVPLLEKAYAKSHGSYQAISGGHIAEAFLDLTGAPTLVYEFFTDGFRPRQFWADLMKFRKQQLPMGCGTSQSQGGIIGMHAYSILDVVEVKNVSFQFFQETGVAHGNVSGFTEFDGTLRLLQIRNPHGKSEWKGDFSDHSNVWEKLLEHQSHGGPRLGGTYATTSEWEDEKKAFSLERTMRNDGKFWIDYDSFLQGFTNVDVVLAFLGNHAKSFSSNFSAKKSNQRCMRAFEVSLIDEGVGARDKVELYIMGIQKTRRGAGHGRVDRKVSYKVCDLGMLVGESPEEDTRDVFENDRIDDGKYWFHRDFSSVRGQMFGFQRNGHYRLLLDRNKNKSLVAMPISFGHPAATDKELSFVLRFVSDAPLLIKELPAVPRLDKVIQKYCLSNAPNFASKQGIQSVLLEGQYFRLVQIDCLGSGGGTVFLYLCVNESELANRTAKESSLSICVEARCRGMSCRTQEGLLDHETIAKGKKFEAAWRKYSAKFHNETKSRLLAVLYQSGQDYQFGGITCTQSPQQPPSPKKRQGILDDLMSVQEKQMEAYVKNGIFNGVEGNEAHEASKSFKTQATGQSPLLMNMDDVLENFQMEQALAMSHGEDTALQHALELSKERHSAHHLSPISETFHFDSDLERAIVESKAMNLPTSKFSSREEEDDLARAIRLSMEDPKPVAKPDVQALLDLTEDSKPSARVNFSIEDQTESLATEAATDNPLSVDDKRRLAAEAAMRRFAQK